MCLLSFGRIIERDFCFSFEWSQGLLDFGGGYSGKALPGDSPLIFDLFLRALGLNDKFKLVFGLFSDLHTIRLN